MALTVNTDFDIVDYIPGAIVAVTMALGVLAALHFGANGWADVVIVGLIFGAIFSVILVLPLAIAAAALIQLLAWMVAICEAICSAIDTYRRPRP